MLFSDTATSYRKTAMLLKLSYPTFAQFFTSPLLINPPDD